jgi:IS5 family transposase
VKGEQRRFASLAWSAQGKLTRRERCLAEMDAVIPWRRLLALIEPHQRVSGTRPAEDAIYDSESRRRFARVELGGG